MDLEELQRMNHAAPKKNFETLINETAEEIKTIFSEEDLRVIKFSWKAYEHILDMIWKKIPPIRDVVPKIASHISFMKVDPERGHEVMKKLLESEVFDFLTDKDEIVSTPETIRRFLSGKEIIIRDLERFGRIRNRVKGLISEILERERELQNYSQTAEVHLPSNKYNRGAKSFNFVVPPILRSKLNRAKEWAHVRFEFGKDDGFVEIFICDETAGKYNFDDLGFRDGRKLKHSPLKSWELMVIMSFNPEATPYQEKQQPTKSDLQKKLKKLFPHLNGVPIQCDPRKKEYRCIFGIKNKAFSRDAYIDQKTEKRTQKNLLKEV